MWLAPMRSIFFATLCIEIKGVVAARSIETWCIQLPPLHKLHEYESFKLVRATATPECTQELTTVLTNKADVRSSLRPRRVRNHLPRHPRCLPPGCQRAQGTRPDLGFLVCWPGISLLNKRRGYLAPIFFLPADILPPHECSSPLAPTRLPVTPTVRSPPYSCSEHLLPPSLSLPLSVCNILSRFLHFHPSCSQADDADCTFWMMCSRWHCHIHQVPLRVNCSVYHYLI
jgi:hypothetical protein